MIFAARCGFSESTLAATSIELYPSALVSKIGVISLMIRSSSSRLVRDLTSFGSSSAAAATSPKGSGCRGKRAWSRFISRLSVSSSGTAAPPLRERSFGVAVAVVIPSGGWFTGGPTPFSSNGLRSRAPSHQRSRAPSHQPGGGVLGEVGDDHVGAGAANRGERLHRGGPLVDPAVLRCGLQHRVLAADVVGRERRAGRVLDPA